MYINACGNTYHTYVQLKSIVYLHAFLMLGYAITAIVWGIMEIAEGGKTDPVAHGVRYMSSRYIDWLIGQQIDTYMHRFVEWK